ncbi:MAG: xanthine dehydrogenase family protein molybdopterin-binding subunit [Chloroflexi bacterium]|nr:xanthine dehydrogenase family protein molybdopterin-binding subunit [Chloroflexota bacterium]
MTTAGEKDAAVVSPAAGYKVIGTQPARFDGAEKVTGRATFGADVRLPSTLQAKMLRSPHAHARIKSIDTSRAEALPGVMAVVTAKDMWSLHEAPGAVDAELKFFGDNFLASDKVLFCGHPIAAVAATDQFIAEEAVKLIEVEYEELPTVLDVFEAMQDSSPLLHDNLYTSSLGKPSEKPSNISLHIQHLKGDPDKGLAEADVIIEREFRTAMVHQGYVEAHFATAHWSPEGNLTIWSNHQGHFILRDAMAKLLQLPVSKIQVIPTEVGGGFGGKAAQSQYVQPVAALLARKAGRPVRLGMSRKETFEATGPDKGSYIRLKVGATRDGKLTAVVAKAIAEVGAFPGGSVSLASTIFSAYEVPNGQVDYYEVVVNKPKSGGYRGPGSTPATFATENVVDEICEQVGIEPLEFRLRNVAQVGTVSLAGRVYQRIGFKEVMEAAHAHEHYRAPLGGPNRGRGLAVGYWHNHGGASSCNLSVNGDGSVSLVSGSVDLSGTRLTVAMQVAEALGIDLNDVRCDVADTSAVGYTYLSGGSRTAFATGLAAIKAAEEALHRMKLRAALIWQVSPDTVTYANGVFATSAGPSSGSTKRLTFKEVAAQLATTGGPISVSSSVLPQGSGVTLAAHIVDVEVDPETGKVRVLRYTAIQDVGKAVNPSLVEGQMQGGASLGVGRALWEGYQFDEKGRLLNTSFLDNKMPTAYDLPKIDTVLVEVPNPGHPYGVRGVGEVTMTPSPAALALAIHRATGVRLRELPMTPARILQKIGVIL